MHYTQIAICKFHEYALPTTPDWLDRRLMPVSETIGTSGYRLDKSFTLNLEHPELFLIPRLRFFVAGSMVQREKPVEFEVVRWTFRYESWNQSTIDLVVREVKLTPFERWFSSLPAGRQYFLAGAAVVLSLAIVGSGVYAIMHFPNPDWFWAWFGHHVRSIVGWGLFSLLLISDMWAAIRFSKSPFRQNVLLFVLSFSALVVPFVWLSVSSPPQPLSGSPVEYIQYVDYLRSRLSTLVLLLAGIIPWLALVLKWLGLDLLASAVSLFAARKKQKPSDS